MARRKHNAGGLQDSAQAELCSFRIPLRQDAPREAVGCVQCHAIVDTEYPCAGLMCLSEELFRF